MRGLESFKIGGDSITPVHEPDDRLRAILGTIASAREYISMFSYMFGDDKTGAEVADALRDAAMRGVHVKLMIDDFGSGDTDPEFFSALTTYGVQFRRFGARWNLGYFVRNHQKILIADGVRAVVGGFNITDAYFARSENLEWEDFGAIIEGDAVARLDSYCQELFELDQGRGVPFRKLRKLIRAWHRRDGPVTWQIGGPSTRISPWAINLKHDLESAARLDIVSAYFFPTRSILRRISKITRKNNGGHIILAGKTDNRATISAARSLYFYLLKRSARIFEFSPRPLHTKLLVIDDISYIGSSNLDVRSLFINMEIMLRIENRELADYLRGKIAMMASQSEEQTLLSHRERASIFRRFKWWFSYFLVNGVDYTIGQRTMFGLFKKRSPRR